GRAAATDHPGLQHPTGGIKEVELRHRIDEDDVAGPLVDPDTLGCVRKPEGPEVGRALELDVERREPVDRHPDVALLVANRPEHKAGWAGHRRSRPVEVEPGGDTTADAPPLESVG